MPYSNCCGAYTLDDDYEICPRCKEHCDFHEEDDEDCEGGSERGAMAD